MLEKLVAGIASFLMLFSFAFPKQVSPVQSPDVLREPAPTVDSTRTFDTIHGVEDSVFYIQRPGISLSVVSGEDFGMRPQSEDNYPALQSALTYCRNHPGTELSIPQGAYVLNNTAPLNLNGLQNIRILGNGARLVFTNVVNGLSVSGSDCVEIRDLQFDWDWSRHPLSDIVVVQNASPKTKALDLVFPENNDVDEHMTLAALTQCDSETLTYGALHSAKEVYVYSDPECIQSVTKTAPDTLHIQYTRNFGNFKDGDTFILRHYVYDTTFAVLSEGSQNITFDGVSLYGYPGSGFYAGSMASHFQILNSYIGVEPAMQSTRHTSLGADAIHIANSNGCFRIENCDISGQGDDALNVHDGLGWVQRVEENRISLLNNAICLRPGDTLEFRDPNFEQTQITARIESVVYNPEATCYDLTLSGVDFSKIEVGFIAYNTDYDSGNYVVRGNYIHENRARGFLLQSSNGLCENNRFYKTEMQALKIVMDISPGLWYEGKGADRIVIRNNTFRLCNYVGVGEVVTIGSNIAGKTATSMPFTNIQIVDNTFESFSKSVLNCNNTNGLQFTGNRINPGKMQMFQKSARAVFGEHCANILFSDNTWQNTFLGPLAKSKYLPVWARINSR